MPATITTIGHRADSKYRDYAYRRKVRAWVGSMRDNDRAESTLQKQRQFELGNLNSKGQR